MSTPIHYKETEFGFEYGDAEIRRLFSDEEDGCVTIGISSSKRKHTEHDCFQIYVTKTGEIRVFTKEGEWLLGGE